MRNTRIKKNNSGKKSLRKKDTNITNYIRQKGGFPGPAQKLLSAVPFKSRLEPTSVGEAKKKFTSAKRAYQGKLTAVGDRQAIINNLKRKNGIIKKKMLE